MFESLTDNLHSALKTLRGKGKLTESNMRDALRLVEEALLEADVSYAAVKDFMGRVTEKSTGERVLKSLNPSEQVLAIVRQELVELLGPVDPTVHMRGEVTVLMLCGLQGSGKTTTCGKLAQLLLENKKQPVLVAADLQRPAAIEQLHVIGRQLGVSVYSEEGQKDPVKVCQAGVQKAKDEGAPVVILDTAGRLAIDQELMDQLKRIDARVHPDQVYLVVDGMTGQDAVNSAKAFNEALELDGVVMTKLDGDARGGALLSVKHVTGVPIKFIGTGEHLDALEPFRPEGMADRILGAGDIGALAREAQRLITEEEREEVEKKLAEGQFTLDDFKQQLEKFSRPGLMQKMMGLMPGMGQMQEMMGDVDAAGETKRLVGIINSMTAAERRDPKLIDPSRRHRIAQGSGVQAHEVNQLVKQYETMKPLVTGMAGKGMRERMQMINELKDSALANPTGKMPKQKKGTGKRLSPKERAKQRKQREKERRKRNRKK